MHPRRKRGKEKHKISKRRKLKEIQSIMSIKSAAASASPNSILLFPSICSRSRSRAVISPGGNSTAKLPFYNKSLYLHRSNKHYSVPRAADSASSSISTTSGKTIVPDNDFTLAKVSFGVIGLGLGSALLSYGFGAYFTILPGSEWSAIMLTYGFPLAIIGMALKYAELKPVPCITYSDAEALRESGATPILKQVRNDVIRYRYGDEQHLEEALKRIFQYGQGGGISRRSAPILQKLREEVTEDGRYSLVLVFEAKALELSDFEKRQGMEKRLIYMKYALFQKRVQKRVHYQVSEQ